MIGLIEGRMLPQFKCLNQECRVETMPIRHKIYDGEIQCRCRVCKTVTVIAYLKGTQVVATVIRNPDE